jgi:uroporphyrinogen decarboxylase
MNSLERVLAVLRGRTPDRVPVMELFIDPSVTHSICPGMSNEDFVDYADLDAATCLTMADPPHAIDWVDRGKGIWRDKWGALQCMTQEVISFVLEPPRIGSEEDLRSYEPPDPRRAAVIGEAKRLVARFHGKRAVAVVGEDCFAAPQYLRAGLANLMMDFVLQPELARRLARISAEYHIELYRLLIAEGVDLIMLGDDYAGKNGVFMSPKHFSEFVLPGLTAVVKAVHDAGAPVIKHSDGNLWKIMDLLFSTGVDMLGPLEPAYVDLAEVRRRSGGRTGVMGNVDVDLLSRGSADQVRQATRELLARMAPLGGHILSSGNSISSSVRGDNYMAMVETARTWSGS